jgi:L-alanine-DL-glutamate epimerase-like enolase superfamily enzyme
MDSAWAYTYGEAVRVGLALQDLGYEWYEDPLAADDLYGYVRLKQQLNIPIMATEITGGGLRALTPWVVEKATDFLRGDVVLKGGITGMLKIAHLAEAFHLPCEVHDAYHSLNNLATLHLVQAIPNCEWFEVLVPHPTSSYDLDHLSYGLSEPIAIDADGYASAPDRPGLGIEVDWDLLRSGDSVELS